MAVQVFKIPESIKKDCNLSFCPGCDHGVAIRIVGEVLDELGLREKTISATSIGCSVCLYDFMEIDCIEAPHGRALAAATGVKRARPDKFVFTYQGDGDFASIGLAESLHAALRGEKISTICINNTTYGMTGGQLGPTTLLGQVTTTSPTGRNVDYYGYPIKIAEQEMGVVLKITAHGKILRNAEVPGPVLAPVSAGDDDFRDRDPEFLKRAVDQRIADEILRG